MSLSCGELLVYNKSFFLEKCSLWGEFSLDQMIFIEKAYDFSYAAHFYQKRSSGEPYFVHLYSVALLLAEKFKDAILIATGLLHDVVEDTTVSLGMIELEFGAEVSRLVGGVTKLSKVEAAGYSVEQFQLLNYKKFILSLIEDPRVLLVKLADRLHNMRTLYCIFRADKRRRIALETLHIFVSLAELISLSDWKDELEDLAFMFIDTKVRSCIQRDVAQMLLKDDGVVKLQKVESQLNRVLEEFKLTDYKIFGRKKTAYSIWSKMQKKKCSFDRLTDIVAFRIVVASEDECYRVLGALHRSFPMIPSRFKDYISLPKRNGYRSLHTCIFQGNQRVEVQIRTFDMDFVAQRGIAAHVGYKESDRFNIIHDLADLLSSGQSPQDCLQHMYSAISVEKVYIFSSEGGIFDLSQGHTVLDFVYVAFPKDRAFHAYYARVNGIEVSWSYVLSSGDQVEVVFDKNVFPTQEQLACVQSGKAKNEIEVHLARMRSQECEKYGLSLLERLCDSEGREFLESLIEGTLEHFSCFSLSELYTKIGTGQLMAHDVFFACYPDVLQEEYALRSLNRSQNGLLDREIFVVRSVILGFPVIYCDQCCPVFDDRVKGILHSGIITVHRAHSSCIGMGGRSDVLTISLCWGKQEDYGVFEVRLACLYQGSMAHVGEVFVCIQEEQGELLGCYDIVCREGNALEFKMHCRVKCGLFLDRCMAKLVRLTCVSRVWRL